MFARTTLFEIDTLRISTEEALKRFIEIVEPELKKQAGCLGYFVLETPEGKGMLLSLWESQEAAAAAIVSGFYGEAVSKFIMLLRQPPGREHYEVAHYELWQPLPEHASSPGEQARTAP